MIWTHHNYNDVGFDLGPNTSLPQKYKDQNDGAQCVNFNRAGLVQDLITGRWTGGPYGDTEVPYVFITEGGVVRGPDWRRAWFDNPTFSDATRQNAQHGECMRRSLERMQGDAEGQGIGMVAQFLNWTTAGYDSGIREANHPTGARRQPAYDTWSAAPSHPNWGD